MDKRVFYDMTYGMFIVSAKDAFNNRNTGCVVNTVSQITSNPAVISVSVNKDNYTAKCIKEERSFTVSILSEDIKPEIIGRFGFKTGADFDKFSGVEYKTVSEGLPVLAENICGWFLCKVLDEYDAGTHIVFFAEVIESERLGGANPMSYDYYHRVIKGKAPKNAPTYIDTKENPVSEVKHVCQVCGYVYDGSKGDFASVPDDYKCPVCGVDKSNFS